MMTFPSLMSSWTTICLKALGVSAADLMVMGMGPILFLWSSRHLPLFHLYFLKYKPYGSSNAPGSRSSHKGMRDQIGKFTAAQMQTSLDEILFYQQLQQRLRLEKIKKLMNHIARNHGLSLVTVNKQMAGKIFGLGSQLRGAQRGKILTASEFQAIWLPFLEISAWVSFPVEFLDILCPWASPQVMLGHFFSPLLLPQVLLPLKL